MLVDLDRIRARHNAWYNDAPQDFPWAEGSGPEEVGRDMAATSAALFDPDDEDIVSAMAWEIVREDVPALIAEVEQLRAKLGAAMNSRRVIRRERDGLLEDLGRVKGENALLKRRLDGLTREEPE